MRLTTTPTTTLFLFLLALLHPTTSQFSPFLPPSPANANDAPLLVRAANPCAQSGTSCSTLGAPSLCCPSKSTCALDPLNNVACCPLHAACTGTISAAPTSTVTATVNPAPTPGAPVPNAYYPYTYLPTTYANAADCSSQYSSCQTAYAQCTGVVGAPNGNRVTVVAAGGVTVQAPVGSASAVTICQSLSSRACYGLQLGSCATGTGSAAVAKGTFVAGTGGAGSGSAGGRGKRGIGAGFGAAILVGLFG